MSGLPTYARFISIDLPGHGQSPWPHRASLKTIGDLVAQEMEKIDSPTFTLVGNCSGALIGLFAIESRPELQARIERLVLIDPFAFAPWYFRIFVTPLFGRLFYYSTFANPLGRWITNLSLRGRRNEETDLTHSFQRINHQATYSYLKFMTSLGSVNRWNGIAIDTDIVYGDRTFSAVRNSVGIWRSVWPHIRISELQQCGHLPILEATGDLKALLFDDNQVLD
ncbi:MAG: alpha/beta fold hydrolase [Acidobacteria bacterium]|nr:alpha/beta fold hydrolase [Acidobacteriota bacterium]